MERNKFSKELIHSQLENNELCHMTPEEKKAYNAEYYKRNKEKYWGVTGNRPVGRQKYVTEGNGQGVQRRGMGLNDYSAITSPNGYNRRAGNQNYPSASYNYKRDDYMDDSLNGYAHLKDGDIRKPAYDKYKSNRHDAIVFQRMAQESHNKANDYKRAANDILKRSRTPEESRKNKGRYDHLMQEAEREERRAKEFEADQKKSEQRMELAYAEMKRLAEEIEAHNPSFTPKPSNSPGVSAQVDTEAFNSAYKKAEKKEKVKKAAKQAASDWKSGAKAVSQLASDGVSKGKSIASAILSKFRK